MTPDRQPPELPAADELTSKGFTLKGALAYVVDRHGETGRADLVEALDDEAMRRALSGVVLSSTWYPFRYQVGLYEAIDRQFGAGDLGLCRHIGRFTADYEMSTIHKLFLKLARLEYWLRSAAVMWRFYYSAGRLDVDLEASAGRGEVAITGFNPISKAFCLDFGGWLERTIEISGRSEVRVEHTTCVLDGEPRCFYDCTFSV